MEELELVEYTNKKLEEGFNLGAVEQELGFGKDTLRKKFKKLGYTYNRKTKQYVTQDNTEGYEKKESNVTPDNTESHKNVTYINTKSYEKEEIAYNNPIIENIGGVDEVKLEEFKALSTLEQVNFINSFADGKKKLGEIGMEQFGTANISNIIPREEAYWDGVKKQYVLIEQKNNVFSEDEIMFIKNLYKQHKNIENVNNIETGEIINRSIRIDKDIMDRFSDFCKENNLKQSNALGIAMLDFMKKMMEDK